MSLACSSFSFSFLLRRRPLPDDRDRLLPALEFQHHHAYREEQDYPDDGGDETVVDVRFRDAPATGEHGAQRRRGHR